MELEAEDHGQDLEAVNATQEDGDIGVEEMGRVHEVHEQVHLYAMSLMRRQRSHVDHLVNVRHCP